MNWARNGRRWLVRGEEREARNRLDGSGRIDGTGCGRDNREGNLVERRITGKRARSFGGRWEEVFVRAGNGKMSSAIS